ncbi:MAG: 16S rRNA (uracil(1498)-N(3))-methyltransferase [Betaproteobacteria bacterium]
MSAARFCVEGMALAEGSEAQLPEAAAHHATRVLRLAAGDAITLFDGRGGEFAARLVRVDKRGARVAIDTFSAIEREAGVALSLVMSVIATDAMDIAVRKAVELGAARIEPVAAARSQGGSQERAARRVEHWQQIVQAACEQCGRNRIPPVAPIVPLDVRLDAADAFDVILAPGAAQSLTQHAMQAAPRSIIVGPEGGFTDAELARAARRGVIPVHMGARVLRAETAAIAALATVIAIAGDAAG